MPYLISLAILGLLLSIYALSVEHKRSKNPKHKALCDLHERVSCSTVLSSPQGKLFGFSNAYLGLLFYTTLIALSLYSKTTHIYYLAILALLGSIYLAYTQYFKLKNFCLVCTLIYIINLTLLFISYSAL